MAWCNTPPRLDNHPWWPKACHHDVVPSSTFASTPGDGKSQRPQGGGVNFAEVEYIHHVHPRTQMILVFDWKGPCIGGLTFKNKGQLGSMASIQKPTFGYLQTLRIINVKSSEKKHYIFLMGSLIMSSHLTSIFNVKGHIWQSTVCCLTVICFKTEQRLSMESTCLYTWIQYVPVEPHEAVAEVSRIGNV